MLHIQGLTPFAQAFRIHEWSHVVFNNGFAGMPNFGAASYGLLNRVSTRHDISDDSLYTIEPGKLRFDTVPIQYDQAAWLRRFEATWPPGSRARDPYFRRITAGFDFGIVQPGQRHTIVVPDIGRQKY